MYFNKDIFFHKKKKFLKDKLLPESFMSAFAVLWWCLNERRRTSLKRRMVIQIMKTLLCVARTKIRTGKSRLTFDGTPEGSLRGLAPYIYEDAQKAEAWFVNRILLDQFQQHAATIAGVLGVKTGLRKAYMIWFVKLQIIRSISCSCYLSTGSGFKC